MSIFWKKSYSLYTFIMSIKCVHPFFWNVILASFILSLFFEIWWCITKSHFFFSIYRRPMINCCFLCFLLLVFILIIWINLTINNYFFLLIIHNIIFCILFASRVFQISFFFYNFILGDNLLLFFFFIITYNFLISSPRSFVIFRSWITKIFSVPFFIFLFTFIVWFLYLFIIIIKR
jgi:hypothetical protein